MYLFLMFPFWCLRMAVLRVCFITFPGYLHLYQFRCTCICSSSFLLDASGWLCSVSVLLHFLGTFTYINLDVHVFVPHLSFWRPQDGSAPWLWHCISWVPSLISVKMTSFFLLDASGLLCSVTVALHFLGTFTYIHIDVHVFVPHLSVMVAFHWLCTFTYIHLDVHVFGPHLSFWMPQDGCPQ